MANLILDVGDKAIVTIENESFEAIVKARIVNSYGWEEIGFKNVFQYEVNVPDEIVKSQGIIGKSLFLPEWLFKRVGE